MRVVYLPPAVSSLGKHLYMQSADHPGVSSPLPPSTLRYRSVPTAVLFSSIREHIVSGGKVEPTPWVSVDNGAVTLLSLCKR